MKDEWKNDDLWELLGHAKPVSVSPFFARNVLRTLRQAPASSPVPAFVLRWLAVGSLAVLTAGFFLNLEASGSMSSGESMDFTVIFDEAAGLNSLLAVEEVSLGDESSDL